VSAAQPSISADVVALLATLKQAGVRLAPDGPHLRLWSPEPIAPELRERLKTHKAEVIAALSIWCPKRAVLLQGEVDDLVASLDVSGTDPEIIAAAERYSAARDAQNMAGTRAACFAIERRARQLAAETRGSSQGAA
jgi:hypothetical protein